MAGLLQQGMAPQGGAPASPQAQPGQPPQQPPQGSPGQGGADPRVDMDPEQGPKQRDQLVNAMLETLYGPMLDQVKQVLEQGRDEPERAIGRIVSQLMLTTWQALNDKGSTVPPGVMVQAAMVAAQAVGEMAINLGILPEQGNGDDIEAGFMLAMAQFGQAAGKDMPEPQRQRYAELIRALREGKEMAQQQTQGQPAQSSPPPQAPPQGMPAEQQGGV